MKNRIVGNRCMYENHTIYQVEYVSPRVRRKRRKAPQMKLSAVAGGLYFAQPISFFTAETIALEHATDELQKWLS